LIALDTKHQDAEQIAFFTVPDILQRARWTIAQAKLIATI
jgi:hypothetical protein